MSDSGSKQGRPASATGDEWGLYGPGRWRYGLVAVLAGVAALVAAFALVALAWDTDQGIAALGVIASPIVAIVSAYFGIQATQQASAQAAKAHEQAGQAREQAGQALADSALSEQRANHERDRGYLLARDVVDREARAPEAPSEAAGESGAPAPEAGAPVGRSAADLARDLYPELFADDRR